jgi:hypothetical protein
MTMLRQLLCAVLMFPVICFTTGCFNSEIILGCDPNYDTYNGDTNSFVREIEEADIVKHIGSSLYILNSYRGLRIVDVADWANPVLKGGLSLTGEPIEMYVDDNVATIVTLNYSSARLDSQGQLIEQGNTTVYTVDVSSPESPALISTYDIEGYVWESRKVGEVIYFAGTLGGDWWGWGYDRDDENTGFVVSLRVADPQNVQLVQREEFPGGGDYIHATQNAVFIAGCDWNTEKTTIQYVDISDPAGQIKLRGRCEVPGGILDRFSLDASESALRVVTDKWSRFGWSNSVKLFTFDISNPDAIAQLAELPIVENESLMAVRFDGDKGYLVTYFQIDPLWVVDLADPANPQITGSLEVPGYSTYLQPQGDQLVAMGYSENWQACVMLYDVADPANPRKLDRILLGDSYSSSEANYDEKALKVLPDAGLILVPFYTWENGEDKNRLQLIGYSDNDLVKLAAVEHRGTAQRSGVDLDANILWIVSQQALQTLDVQDRQVPDSLATLILAENVLAWKVVGDYGVRMLQLNPEYWNPVSVEIQIVSADDPNGNDILDRKSYELDYPSLTFIDDELAVLSGQDDSAKIITFDLTTLPTITPLAEKELDFYLESPQQSYSYYPLFDSNWEFDGLGPILLENKTLVFPSYIGLELVSLADPADPVVVGTVEITDVTNCWGVSGNTVFYTTGDFDFYYSSYSYGLLGSLFSKKSGDFDLNRVDCTDPANPVKKSPIKVPGYTVGLRGDIAYVLDSHPSFIGETANRFHAVKLTDSEAQVLSSVKLPEGEIETMQFAPNAAVCSIYSFSWGGFFFWSDSDYTEEYRVVSLNLSDANNLKITLNKEHSSWCEIIGATDQYVVGTLSSQALIWQIAEDQSLTLKKVVDGPGNIMDVVENDPYIDLICGQSGIFRVNPSQ